MTIQLPKTAANWTALLMGLGVVAQAVGVSVPQFNRAEANKKAGWQLSDELKEEKAALALVQCKYDACLGLRDMDDCFPVFLPGETQP